MKYKNSWRHHYIPVFYLKGFTGKTGKFYIYSKEKDRVINSQQSPKSYFFEKNRHTLLNLENDLDDFIETELYSSFDNYSSTAIIKLRNVPLSEFNDNVKLLSKIVLFINGLIYRIPKYDEYHNKKIELGRKEYLLPIHDKHGRDVSYEFHIKNKTRDIYKYACRFSCSVRQSIPTPEEARNWAIYTLPNDYDNKYYLLSGDSPVLIDDIAKFKTEEETIIAPLTKSHFVIRSKQKLNQDIDALELLHRLNIGVIISSTKYVCSPEGNFLKKYIEYSERYDEKLLWNEIMELFI